MRILLLNIIILLGLNISAVSEEYHTYNQELIRSIPTGNKPDELGYSESAMVSEPAGPAGINFNESGELYISDYWNKRIVIYNNNLKSVKKIIPVGDNYALLGGRPQILEDDGIAATYISKYSKITKDGKVIFNVSFQDSPYEVKLNGSQFYFYKNYFFHYLRDDGFICIPEFTPDSEENLKKILNVEQTKLLIKNKEKTFADLRIDEKNRIFINDELVTNDYKVFYEYWEEKHKLSQQKQPRLNFTARGDKFLKGSPPLYLGEDKDMNYYWVKGFTGIIVFNSEGWLIELFSSDRSKVKMLPAVHPSGDVYFMGYSKDKVYLYKIPRIW